MANKKRWIQTHRQDPFVKQAKKEGLCSRAAYKLIEIQEKYQLIKPAMKVLELGASPGGWTQIIQRYIGRHGKIIAIDVLPVKQKSKSTIFIQGDITDTATIDQLADILKNKPVDVVLSDMSPNLSGQNAIDQPRMIRLIESTFILVKKFLRPEGSFLFKLFQGEGSDALIKEMKTYFDFIKCCKPDASRAKSREVYVLARDFHNK